ncbi:MAG TPA: polymer-forming cytoskeletal protein [Gemmatimonadota bacterium]|nr:polymer-forming cytoskeletal protein [Gemmatimonadota bacterium]
MAIWKDPSPAIKEPVPVSRDQAAAKRDDAPASEASSQGVSGREKKRESMESVIGADLTIEGKIEGSGHVRLVGKFNGDVQVEGDLTIEPGAKVTGSVRAAKVTVGGELEGNIESASSVELLKTGVLNGDLKAGSLTVVAGSRMRGQAEFGWDDREVRAPRMKVESGSTS